MKTTAIMLMAAMTASVLVLKAQDKTQGKISYEQTTNLHASLKPDQQQFKDMIPEFSTTQEDLYFNNKRTKIEHKETEDQVTDGGTSVKIKMEGGKTVFSDGTPEGTYFLSEEDGKPTLISLKTKSEESMKKMDISPDKIVTKTEKIGKRTKNIIGFECTEVVSGEATLWVTTALPFRSGPLGMISIHGAILGMEVEKGKMKCYAKAIEYIPVKLETVTPPSGLEIK